MKLLEFLFFFCFYFVEKILRLLLREKIYECSWFVGKATELIELKFSVIRVRVRARESCIIFFCVCAIYG